MLKKALTLNFVLVCTCMYSLRGEFNSSTTFNNTKNVIFLEGHCVCGERLHTHTRALLRAKRDDTTRVTSLMDETTALPQSVHFRHTEDFWPNDLFL